jgi:hypothetical protein
MQAIGTRKAQRAEPSQKLVLAAAGALLAILCLLVLVAAVLNSGSAANRSATVSTQPAVSVAQGADNHARSEQGDAQGSSNSGSSGGSQPTHGALP